jgi:antibiotic biosynthesis monooxygenase (ABM) superfamily enzyme
VIPGLLETHVGPNLSPRGKGYTFGGVMRFKDQATLDAYVQHPAHQALLVWLRPLIDAIELDLNA